MAGLRALVIVLGDQLDLDSSAFDGFDNARDAVFMAEVSEESTRVWSTKQRTALFLSAMRHFAQSLSARGRTVHYTRLDDEHGHATLRDALQRAVGDLKPTQLVLTAPGDWRVFHMLRELASANGLPLDTRDDRHFYCTVREFAAHGKARRDRGQELRMEYFYREMRMKHGVLMDGAEPAGGRWNFDADNRKSFGREGPGTVPARVQFVPDETTREVIALVQSRFADHPGTLDSFAWALTREQALHALSDFIEHRLAHFGEHQDAMWPDEPWLYHAQLSAALNLKLINPREVIAAAQDAWRADRVPLPSAEGFIRQIIGWREYVRGIYWTQMPGYVDRNALAAQGDLPAWYWTGETDMACLHDVIKQTLAHGYAHHIQRLMVTGLYAMLLGVAPRQVHEWYLAVYVDAVEWVELPNTLGMSQYADGGLMASKPYAATGRYIERMASGYCAGCKYDPAQRVGDDACPFTTLYWDFLMRHAAMLQANPRMRYPLENLGRLDESEKVAIRARADALRQGEATPGGTQ